MSDKFRGGIRFLPASRAENSTPLVVNSDRSLKFFIQKDYSSTTFRMGYIVLYPMTMFAQLNNNHQQHPTTDIFLITNYIGCNQFGLRPRLVLAWVVIGTD